MSLQTVKSIDKHTDCIVSGYIREVQKLFPPNVPFYIIATAIQHLCILYYFVIPNDKFTHFRKPDVTISNQNELTHTGTRSCTSYGDIDIYGSDPCIYRWTFKIYGFGSILIGIASNNTYIHEAMYSVKRSKYKYYAYGSNATVYDHIDNRAFQYGTSFSSGSTITMELNVPQTMLAFFKNNQFQGVVDDNVDFSDDTKYSMAVSTKHILGVSIQLIDFQRWMER